jgi:hypothetical protein
MNENAERLLEVIEGICKIWGKASLYQIYSVTKLKFSWDSKETRFWLKYLFDRGIVEWVSDGHLKVCYPY